MKPITLIEPLRVWNQEEQLLLAGERAQPGLYRNVVNQREVLLEQEDMLPATCDGQVACYALIRPLSSRCESR